MAVYAGAAHRHPGDARLHVRELDRAVHVLRGRTSGRPAPGHLAFIALAWHAWIGVRDLWMDYVKSVGLRLLLQVLTILWLVGSVVYFPRKSSGASKPWSLS